jgi:hypothetical protein
MKALQPSTKEAYDAQFVVKEPEFVLPKKWTLLVTKENYKIIVDYINKVKPNWGWNYKNCLRLNLIKNSCDIEYGPFVGTMTDTIIYGQEITFDQFKKYVLKQQLEEPKDKVLQINEIRGKGTTITKVESSEGAIYRIGDKITVFTKDSPNKGRILNIKSFRWNNAKTAICAITEIHGKNGIGLDKIELYSEPVKKELSLLEQAKLKYPIGTKVKSLFYNTVQGNIININFKSGRIWANLNTGQGIFLYSKRDNKWAEIVDDFKLPENWCVRGGLNVCETLS